MKEEIQIIPPRSATSFIVKAGNILTVIDPNGEQVADLVTYNAADIEEYLSAGRTIDYASNIFMSIGDVLWSNRSQPMLTIIADDVGRHDFSLAPCSREMFRMTYGDVDPQPGCQGNLETVLAVHGVQPDRIPVAFNIFMNVVVDGLTGKIEVRPPLSKPGDCIRFRAEMDLIIGLTACSAGQSNNFSFKPVHFSIRT
jgi:uncharacterized protein